MAARRSVWRWTLSVLAVLVLVPVGAVALVAWLGIVFDAGPWREASVEMSDAPTGAGALVSLWQTNCVGILCERYVTWLVGRSNAVQALTVTTAAALGAGAKAAK